MHVGTGSAIDLTESESMAYVPAPPPYDMGFVLGTRLPVTRGGLARALPTLSIQPFPFQ
jgi:hypothetical protein